MADLMFHGIFKRVSLNNKDFGNFVEQNSPFILVFKSFKRLVLFYKIAKFAMISFKCCEKLKLIENGKHEKSSIWFQKRQ